jgi:hypothetical protein
VIFIWRTCIWLLWAQFSCITLQWLFLGFPNKSPCSIKHGITCRGQCRNRKFLLGLFLLLVVRHLFGYGRYEWYQTTSLVVVCILAKAVEEEDLKVHFNEHIVCSKFYLLLDLDFFSQIVWLYVSWASNDLYVFPDQLHNFYNSFFTLHWTVQKNGSRPLLSGHCVFLKAQW